jgi:lipoprotein NlpD
MRIGLDNGQSWRDIARWNGLENPNLIEVGQVLRVVPPGPVAASATAAATQPVTTGERTESRPLSSASATGAASGLTPATAAAASTASIASTASTAAAAPAASGTAGTAAAAREGDDDVAWAWPAAGPVLGAFDEARNKGIAIGGKAGDAVLAAADGRVVYAGSGLRGYGNLVIVKHNNTYLTAYAHNQALLVKDDQVVRRGQKIAEMGSTEAERVQLHFEIRRQGRPVDPARLLPAR